MNMTSYKQLAIQLMPSAGLILRNYLELIRRLRLRSFRPLLAEPVILSCVRLWMVPRFRGALSDQKDGGKCQSLTLQRFGSCPEYRATERHHVENFHIILEWPKVSICQKCQSTEVGFLGSGT
jgi:hypothetical protein